MAHRGRIAECPAAQIRRLARHCRPLGREAATVALRRPSLSAMVCHRPYRLHECRYRQHPPKLLPVSPLVALLVLRQGAPGEPPVAYVEYARREVVPLERSSRPELGTVVGGRASSRKAESVCLALEARVMGT